MEHERDSESTETADELVPMFERCTNYPRTPEGFQFLCQGLVKAATGSGIAMRAIVDECLKVSQYCPTDYDLLAIATEMKLQAAAAAEAERDRHAEWRRQYGPPRGFDVLAEHSKLIMSTPPGGRWFQNRALLDKLAQYFGDSWGKAPIVWRELFAAKEQLGYALTESERVLAGRS